ncbi:MAG: anticodon-binding protein [Microcystis aeruginosa G11-09]|nr:anticodon-binding protein [Microcystis aeruginosa G11-09]
MNFICNHPSIEHCLKQQLINIFPENNHKLTFYRCPKTDIILYRSPLFYYFTPAQFQTIFNHLIVLFPQIQLKEGWLELLLDQQFLSFWLLKLNSGLLQLLNREKIRLIESELLSWHHPAEIALILQILTVCDCWERQKPYPLTANFCEAMLNFERNCRIIGESAPIQRSRLILISVSQKLLNRLLRQKWQLLPMTEL